MQPIIKKLSFGGITPKKAEVPLVSTNPQLPGYLTLFNSLAEKIDSLETTVKSLEGTSASAVDTLRSVNESATLSRNQLQTILYPKKGVVDQRWHGGGSTAFGLGSTFSGGTNQSLIYVNPAATISQIAVGTNGQVLTVVAGAPAWAAGAATGITVGTTTITSGVSGRILYDNAGIVGEMTTTGSGTVVALATSPVLVTPDLGTPSAATLTNATGLPIVAGTTGTLTEVRGGTNQTTFTTGDTLYASAANTLSKLAIGTTGQVLKVVAGIPAWGTATPAYYAENATAPTISPSVTTGQVAIGDGATATAAGAISFGKDAHATKADSIVIGTSSSNSATATNSIAIGNGAIVNDTGSIAIGKNCQALDDNTIGIGTDVITNGGNCVVIGNTADGSGGGSSVIIGYTASNVAGGTGVAIGSNTTITGSSTSAIGVNVVGGGNSSVAIGSSAVTTVGGDNTIAIGVSATTDAASASSIAIGQSSTTTNSDAISLGHTAVTAGQYGISIGSASAASALNTIAIGQNTIASASSAIAIGNSTNVNTANSIAIGDTAAASFTNCVALGAGATASAANQFVLPTSITTLRLRGTNYTWPAADGTAGQVLQTSGAGVLSFVTVAGGTGAFWTAVPGSPVRVSNTQFTLTDTGNAGSYDLLISRSTVLKWTEAAVIKQAMVVSSSYSANVVTVNIMGDTMASIDASSLKYASEKARSGRFAIAGTLATGNDLAGRFWPDALLHIFGADGHHGTAGTTGASTYTLSLNSTAGAGTILAADVSIASAATAGDGFTANNGQTVTLDDYVALNCTAVSTTAPVDAYISMYYAYENNKYLS